MKAINNPPWDGVHRLSAFLASAESEPPASLPGRLPEKFPPKELRIIEIIEQEAPEYTSLFWAFLFREVYGVEWKRELPPIDSSDDVLCSPTNPPPGE